MPAQDLPVDATMPEKPLQLALLISGSGRTVVNLHQRIADGTLSARVRVVVSSRADVGGVQRSRELGIPTTVLERRSLSPREFQRGINDAVAGADLVCMAGFLSLWHIPQEWHGRVINIHPALLPEFGGRGMYGLRVHEAVLAAGRTQSGCTIHFCDNQYDHGPIILQRKVPVLPHDTPGELAARVFEQECIAYPAAIALFAEDRIRLDSGTVTIA